MSLSWLLLVPLAVYVVVKYRNRRKQNIPLPPGPPADPLIGHLRSIPQVGQDVYFYELGLKYGGVAYLNAMGQSMVILNSVQAATELLDKRGANYSDRPTLQVFNLMGLGNTLPFERYGPEWRRQRAMVHQGFNKEKCKEYRPIQSREARVLAQNLLTTTGDKLDLFLRYSTGVIIAINYGHQIQSDDDPYLKIAGDVSRVFMDSGPVGATPIDLFPFLRYFPSWFPGSYYASYARNALPTITALLEYPYSQLKKQMTKGAVKPSFLASMLEDLHRMGEEKEVEVRRTQIASSVVYLAGAETTSATLTFFLLAMVLYPEFQIKAQHEIDRVVGPDRLPEFQDRKSLPYLECVFQETMRWYQPTPAGVPHKSMEDDIYDGMLIPKGSLVIPNVRGMTLDETVYKNPFTFDPSRFLPSPEGRGEPYPIGQFGFGRRICPGRHLGEESVWIAIATILATSTISRSIGKDMQEIVPVESVIAVGITSRASPFPCDVKPRNRESFDLLQRHLDS